jgi:hypothetical protein
MDERTAPDGFPVTRSTMDEFDGWVQRLATPLLPARRVPYGASFRWQFREEAAYVLLVAKSVRMVSGIRAAMLLADNGFVAESACLLRIVSDLATEIAAVAEGELRGEPTKAQKDFVAEFFAREPFDADAALQQEKRRYVSREELMKAHVRLANSAGLDGEDLRDRMRAIVGLYDAYVHGAYTTAMDLYRGDRLAFMLRGHEDPARVHLHRVMVSSKLVELMHALDLVARVAGDRRLHSDILAALGRLEESCESTGATP